MKKWYVKRILLNIDWQGGGWSSLTTSGCGDSRDGNSVGSGEAHPYINYWVSNGASMWPVLGRLIVEEAL